MKRVLLKKQRTFRITEETDRELRALADATRHHEAVLIRFFVTQAVSYYQAHPNEIVLAD